MKHFVERLWPVFDDGSYLGGAINIKSPAADAGLFRTDGMRGAILESRLVAWRIRIITAPRLAVIIRSCAYGSRACCSCAIVCATMHSAVNPGNTHRRKRPPDSGLSFVNRNGSGAGGQQVKRSGSRTQS